MQMHPDILAEIARQRQASLMAEARISRGRAVERRPVLWRRLFRLPLRTRQQLEPAPEQGEMGWSCT